MSPDDPYRRYDIPELGFENYWYPIFTTRELGTKPKPVKLLGKDIVLFRNKDQVHALDDRCPHCGVRLSLYLLNPAE